MTVNSEVQVKLMEVAGPVRKRRTVRIDREETRWKVDLDRVSDIGFSATAAAKARRDFAALLMKIGKRIAPKAPKASSLPSDPDAVVETVKEALRLSDAELRDVKYPLRDIGLELYKSLSSEMRVSLVKQGILTKQEDREDL